MSDSLWPHGLQHARPPCSGVSSSSCPLNWWCHPTISSSAMLFSFCLQSFPASGSFLMRWKKYWSLSFSLNPSNKYSGFISLRIDWFDLFAVQGTLKNLLQHHNLKAAVLQCLLIEPQIWKLTLILLSLIPHSIQGQSHVRSTLKTYPISCSPQCYVWSLG